MGGENFARRAILGTPPPHDPPPSAGDKPRPHRATAQEAPRCAARGLGLVVVGQLWSWGPATYFPPHEWAWPWAASSCRLASHQGLPAHLSLCPSLLTSLASSYANHLPARHLGTMTGGRLTNRRRWCSWHMYPAPHIHPHTPHAQRTRQTWGSCHPHLDWPHSHRGEVSLGREWKRACWLTFIWILSCGGPWGCGASRGRKRLPDRLPKPGGWSHGASSGLFSTKGKQPHTGANEERKQALVARGKWSREQSSGNWPPSAPGHALDCVQARVPPERAWTIPAPRSFHSLLCWGPTRVFHNQLPATKNWGQRTPSPPP